MESTKFITCVFLVLQLGAVNDLSAQITEEHAKMSTIAIKDDTSQQSVNRVTYYQKVTSEKDIVDGGIYLFSRWVNGKAYFLGASTTTSSSIRRKCIELKTDDTVATEVNTNNYPYEITLRRPYSNKATCTLQLSNGNYLTGLASNNKLTENESILTDNEAKAKKGHNKWTISAQDTTFTFQLVYSSEQLYLAVSSVALNWGCLKSGEELVLYRRLTELPVATTEGYATYYSDHGFVIPEGLTATTITGANENGKLEMPWEYQAGDIVPAQTGLLLHGTPGTTYLCYARETTSKANENNALHGFENTTDITGKDNMYYYFLTYSNVDGQKKLGFFWRNDDGSAFQLEGGRAYLQLPVEQTANTRSFYSLEQPTTSIPQLRKTTPTTNVIYDLNGRNIQGDSSIPQGLYLVNGQKVFIH